MIRSEVSIAIIEPIVPKYPRYDRVGMEESIQMRVDFSRVSFFGILVCVMACGSSEEMQIETTPADENEPQCDAAPSEV